MGKSKNKASLQLELHINGCFIANYNQQGYQFCRTEREIFSSYWQQVSPQDVEDPNVIIFFIF